MTDSDLGLVVWESEDGLLVLGDDTHLALLDRQAPMPHRVVPPRALRRIGAVLKGGEEIAAQSGRWFKADSGSAAWIKEHGVKGLDSGVVRLKDVAGATGDGGRIAKHLTFEKAGLLSPAAPAVLSAMVTQQALAAQMDEITAYLEVIDEKLDQLVAQRKIETAGQLGGVGWAVDEASTVYDETGHISAVTWSKVQANALVLSTAQAEAVGHLVAVAERIRKRKGDTDGLAAALGQASEDVTFWLGIMARAMVLQDKQHVLELARLADEDPAELDAHRRGIGIARDDRARRIAEALTVIGASIREVSDLTNFSKVANPFTSQRATSAANAIVAEVSRFVAHVDLGVAGVEQLDRTTWGEAMKGLYGETTTRAGVAGARVSSQARSVAGHLARRREQSLLAKADKIKARRGEVGPEDL